MHKRNFILSFALCLILSVSGKAQSIATLKSPPTLLERYLIDYEVVGLQDPNESDLSLLDLNQYEDLRLEDENLTITDAVTGYDVILYSLTTSIANWNSKLSEQNSSTDDDGRNN